MCRAREHLWYRAEESLLTSATVFVTLPDGYPHARIRRDEDRQGRPRWRWTGGGLGEFVVEAETPATAFLITDGNGAPFGRIHQRGLLLPRLRAVDARRERFVVDVDGRLATPRGPRVALGRIDLPTPWQGRLERVSTDDGTLRALLCAAPLCHALQTLLLQV